MVKTLGEAPGSAFSPTQCEYFTMSDAKALMGTLIKKVALEEPAQLERSIAVRGLCVHLFVELGSGQRNARIDELLNALLTLVKDDDTEIGILAVHMLAALSYHFRALSSCEAYLPEHVIQALTRIIDSMLRSYRGEARAGQSVVIALYFCLLDWIMAAPNDLLDNSHIGSAVFSVLDMAVNARLPTPAPPNVLTARASTVKPSPLAMRRTALDAAPAASNLYSGDMGASPSKQSDTPGLSAESSGTASTAAVASSTSAAAAAVHMMTSSARGAFTRVAGMVVGTVESAEQARLPARQRAGVGLSRFRCMPACALRPGRMRLRRRRLG